jgi:ligand-binding sensor domain-containing protein
MKHTLVVLSLVSAAFAQQVPPPPAGVPAGPAAKGTVVEELSRKCWYLFQAKNGDYWFGSEDRGVFRYDGTKIINYTTADGLSGSQVRGMQGDKAGNVYFSTSGGINKFDGRVFSALTPVDPPDREAGGGWRLHADDLWFGGGKGILRFDGTTLYDLKLPKSDLEEAFNAKYPHHRIEPYAVYSTFRDSRGHLWIGTQNFGVIRYDGRSFGWLYEDHHTHVPGGGLFGLRAVIEDKNGLFWICNTRYRYRVEPENKDGKVPYTREEGIDRKMTDGEVVYFQGAEMDAAGDLWLSPYGGGIYRWDGKGMTNYPVRDGGRDTQVFKIFKDNGGVMWLGTPTAGPFRFNGTGFEQFKVGAR